MKFYRALSGIYSLIFILASTSVTKAQENLLHTELEPLEQMVVDLKRDLESGKLTDSERNQVYDIIGSLKICMPVAQTVMEQPAINFSQLEADSSLAVAPSSIESILKKFMILKQALVQQLSDNKITPDRHESAYTLIGSINLCMPILKGADLLRERLKKELDQEAPVVDQSQHQTSQDN